MHVIVTYIARCLKEHRIQQMAWMEHIGEDLTTSMTSFLDIKSQEIMSLQLSNNITLSIQSQRL